MELYIKTVREERSISIRKLAAMTGISPSHIVRIENGESMPTISTLCKIAKALDVCPGLL